jgi:hypothetical protein
VSVCREAHIRSQTEVVVIVIRDSLSKNQLKDHVVVFERRKAPNTGQRHAVRTCVPSQIEHLFIRHDSADISEQSGGVKVAVIVFVTVEADQIRKLRGANRRAELGAEWGIGAGLLNGDTDGMVFAQRLGVTELRKSRRYDAGRTFKLQSIGKGIWIGEGTPGLTGQKILVLPIELPAVSSSDRSCSRSQTRNRPSLRSHCYPKFPAGFPR